MSSLMLGVGLPLRDDREVTSRYAAILDERDTSLADTLESIFDGSRSVGNGHENTTEFDDAAELLPISTE